MRAALTAFLGLFASLPCSALSLKNSPRASFGADARPGLATGAADPTSLSAAALTPLEGVDLLGAQASAALGEAPRLQPIAAENAQLALAEAQTGLAIAALPIHARQGSEPLLDALPAAPQASGTAAKPTALPSLSGVGERLSARPGLAASVLRWFWTGARAGKSDEIPDAALTGAAGAAIRARLEKRAADGIAAVDAAYGEVAEPAPERAATREERVENWIMGFQALVPREIRAWLLQRQEHRDLSDPLDIETFHVAVAQLNAALGRAGRAPIDLGKVDALTENEPGVREQLKADGHPDLREVGAYHAAGRIRVYAGLADIASPRQLAAVVLHEHLASGGMPHSQVVREVARLTASAFGKAVPDAQLQALARAALSTPVEPDRGGILRRRLATRKESASLARRPSTYYWLALALAAGALLFAASAGAWTIALLLGAAALASAGLLVSAHHRRQVEAEVFPVREVDGRPLGFRPQSVSLRGISVEAAGESHQIEVSFTDGADTLVSLIAHPAAHYGGDRLLEVRWEPRRPGLEPGGFFVLSRTEMSDDGRPAPAVSAESFVKRILPHFRRAADEYAPMDEADGRETAAAFREFENAANNKSYDTGEPPQYGRWHL